MKKPGVVLCDAGVTIRELIEEFCGGMEDGHTFKGVSRGARQAASCPHPWTIFRSILERFSPTTVLSAPTPSWCCPTGTT